MSDSNYSKGKLPEANNLVLILSRYLNDSDIALLDGLNYERLRKVIHTIVSDFFNYKIDSDELSFLSGQLMILCQDFRVLRNSDLYLLLLDMAELEVCLRHSFKTVPDILDEMEQFRKNQSNIL